MENVSKALIIAGGVLIALLVISLVILMVNSISDYQNSNADATREQQIADFNNEYTAYERTNIRGSELLSLLNKVIDYNERKAEVAGTTENEGNAIAFKPITITVNIPNINLLANPDNKNVLFKSTQYKITKNAQDDKLKQILTTAKGYEDDYGGIEVIQKLVANAGSIFLSSTNPQDYEKEQALKKFNAIVKGAKATNYNTMVNQNKNKVYQYYEYTQFKRAYFNNDSNTTKYDTKTGRIIEMSFTATGKLN